MYDEPPSAVVAVEWQPTTWLSKRVIVAVPDPVVQLVIVALNAICVLSAM